MGCVTWCMNAFVHMDTKEFYKWYWTEWKKFRPEGQHWQILRQVSPTQSHQSNGAAKNAVFTVRGLLEHIWQ